MKNLLNMDDEWKDIEEWASIKYMPFSCPKCGRHRVELCENKKHWCEKCNWVIQDRKYYNPEWRI